ncbi:hypothetical protein LZC95_40945 [Pendulispora brunnea]|uniref:Peptidase M61 catalytic domain-containing protein n=1 Tax=Pendulispora brunnea TaxID=2905690 RepID=A0ABZ2K252_9BACT
MRTRALAIALATLGCGETSPVSKTPPAARHSGGEAVAWAYEVTANRDATELDVVATLTGAASTELSVSESAEPFVREVRVERGSGWETVSPRGTSWFVPECASVCRLRYRFDLRGAAAEVVRDSIARRVGDGVFESPPHAWLLHPLQTNQDDRARFHVATEDGVRFATGLRATAMDTYEIRASEIARVPYSLFGRFHASWVRVGDTSVQLAIVPGRYRASEAELTQWIARSAGAVRDYYGAFPVKGALYGIVPRSGDSVGFGRASAGAGGASILIDVGRDADDAELRRDWVAVHETLHLTMPSLAREHIWAEEGLATYLEPIVRRRAGLTSDEDLWRQFYEMMPNGLPRAGDRGLDNTHTWGRIYWGGAIFWLVADVEIRKRTQNAHALGDAVQAILRAGGNNSEMWDASRMWDEGDRATGTHVLRELATSMGSQPGSVDLAGLFRELGVSATALDDSAPKAALRKAITAR